MSHPQVVASRKFSSRAAVVEVAGDCDTTCAPRLIEAVTRLVEDDHTRLVVDLSDVTSLDSAMLSALLHVQKNAERWGWQIALVRPRSERAWRLFELTALEHRFASFQTRTAATIAVRIARV